MRHFAHEHEMSVDPGAAVVQLGGYLERAAYVARPYGTCEPEVGVVGPGNSLGRIVEAGDRHHRPEHLAPHDLVGLQRARDHGRLVEKSTRCACLAACGDFNMTLARRPLHEARHAASLALRDQRPHLHAVHMLLTYTDRAHSAGEVGDK